MSRKDSSVRKPEAGSAVLSAFRNTARWLKGLALLAIGGSVLLGLHMWPRQDTVTGGPGADPDSTVGARPARAVSTSTDKGPWGRLKYLPITISPPLELIPSASPQTWKGEWHFSNMIPARLPALLSEIGLSEPLREKLVSLAEVNLETEGLVIRPTPEIILGMSPEDRSVLYIFLHGSPRNVDQRSAFRFCGGSLDEWIGDVPLAPETRRLIEPLVFRYGSFLFFSDLSAIEDSLPSPEQRSLLIKALSHESTFLVELELTDETDLGELVDYWGRGGRAGEVRPILESLQRSDGERSIDITYLLPPFARSRLYTYHVFSEEKVRVYQDCHWTALNFFSLEPDDRFAETTEVFRKLKQDYNRIYGNLRLGDVVAFIDQTTLIHTAVFVADDFVFTKNGRGSVSPWMLMKLEDMKYYYPTWRALTICYYRRKDL